MNRDLIEVWRPPVVTGVLPDGWITRRLGDLIVHTYRTNAGQLVFEQQHLTASGDR